VGRRRENDTPETPPRNYAPTLHIQGRVDKSIISADNDVRRLQTGLLRPEIKLTGDIQVDADVTRNDKGQDSQLVLPAFWHVGANVALTVSDLFWFTVIFIDYRVGIQSRNSKCLSNKFTVALVSKIFIKNRNDF
jgi:hypothetical protein